MVSVEIACEYIIDKIVNPSLIKRDDSVSVYIAKVDRSKITDEKIEDFREVLEAGITYDIEMYGKAEIKTEYMPVGLLYDSLQVAELPLDVCPLNMDVMIDKYSVKARVGTNMPVITIYNEELDNRKKLVLY